MTGTYLLPTPNITAGFVRDSNGAVTTFAPPVTNDGIIPQVVNSSGKVVGYYYDKTGPTIVQRGFIGDSAGTFTTFSVPGSEATQLLSINDAGLITGVADGVAIQLTTPPSFSLPDPP